jgi:hypothetical protein
VTKPGNLVHVFTRKYLAALILANPTDSVIEWVLTKMTFGCPVTEAEHDQLTRLTRRTRAGAATAKQALRSTT